MADVPFSQSFEADVSVERIGTGIGLTMNKIRGNVSGIILDSVSDEFEKKEYKNLDVAEVRLALATGYKAVLEMGTGNVYSWEIVGIKEEEDKKVKMAVKAINGDMPIAIAFFKKAKISIVCWRPLPAPYILAGLPQYSWTPALDAQSAVYDSNKKMLSFRNGDMQLSPVPTFLSAAAAQDVPIIFWFLTSGSKKSDKIVATVNWVKVDSEGVHVKISKDGLNGVGATAKDAIDSLDEWKSGRWKVGMYPLAAAADIVPGPLFHGRAERGASWSILDVKGELNKTTEMGIFDFKFRSKGRILYAAAESGEEGSDKKVIKSISGNNYMKMLAKMFDDDCGEWWVTPRAIFARMKTASGKEVLGEIQDVRWNENSEMWEATVATGFEDSAKLMSREIVVRVGVLWGGGMWNGIVTNPGDA